MNKATTAPTDPAAPPVDGMAGLKPSPEQLRERVISKQQQALVDTLAAALRESSPHYMCWPCWESKSLWDAQNHDALEMARAQAADAGSTDILEFLPEPLRPADDDPLGKTGRMPATFEVWTYVGGTGICALHATDAILEQARIEMAKMQLAAQQHAEAEAAAAAQQQQPAEPPQPPKPQIVLAPGGPSLDTLANAAATDPNLPGQTSQLPPRRGAHRAR